MYRETLIEQKKFLEERQKACERVDLAEVIELSRQIITIAKKVDEYDEEHKNE